MISVVISISARLCNAGPVSLHALIHLKNLHGLRRIGRYARQNWLIQRYLHHWGGSVAIPDQARGTNWLFLPDQHHYCIKSFKWGNSQAGFIAMADQRI
ncbi:hypothetical protein C1H71_20695 (plasmid) [Iodobacter fluviatilis]|uniref:Uncharacterized protein n=1 Tax=Iodobacter fluviatilis TaxID=537 RepID=A0A7G3GFH6_9NEIS|nr:hypothetical protein C1H71_20695 [Iodobacter fluviatilis]